MPQCGCFHKYALTRTGPNVYELKVPSEGEVRLDEILRNAGVARSVSVNANTLSLHTTFTLRNVHDETALRNIMDLLTSVMLVDLRPKLDECYALAPYTIFDERNISDRSRKGELLYQAKYKNNRGASNSLAEELKRFVEVHPTLAQVNCFVAAPKVDLKTDDVAGRWARDMADERGCILLQVNKVRQSRPQKEIGEEETEEQVRARVAGNFKVEKVPHGTTVVVVDDTIRSGGTLIDIGRALREAGAEKVFGLAIAKDAKFTLGGIDLSVERWQ